MILTIISPDKLTLAMFSKFFRTWYSTNTVVIEQDINCLFSDDYQTSLITSLRKNIKETEALLIRYKSKYNVNKVTPSAILDNSDYVIKFDLYSVKPEILKVLDSTWFDTVLNNWNLNLEKLTK
jgi:hypothetical protein